MTPMLARIALGCAVAFAPLAAGADTRVTYKSASSASSIVSTSAPVSALSWVFSPICSARARAVAA